MLTPATYQLTRSGCIHYLFWACVFSVLGVFVLSSLFTDQAQPQGHVWLVYMFVGLVIVLWLRFAGYCVLRAIESTERVIVDADGFSYKGILKISWFSWKDITAVRWLYDQSGFEWLEVTIKPASKRARREKLDFSGLRSKRIAFINQVRTLAPLAMAKWH